MLLVCLSWWQCFFVFLRYFWYNFLFLYIAVLTNDAEDAQNVGSKDHQYVDDGEQNDSNGNVTQPVERLCGKDHMLDGSTDLWTETGRWFNEDIIPQHHIYCETHGTNQQQTYREQHNRDSQRHGREDGDSHTQDQSVERINPAVCVQQFRLHIA